MTSSWSSDWQTYCSPQSDQESIPATVGVLLGWHGSEFCLLARSVPLEEHPLQTNHTHYQEVGMTHKDHWHLDDEGRLYQAMRAQDRNKVEWHGLPAARTRAEKKADRLLDGFIVILHLTVAGLMGVFALSMLGYIDDPFDKKQAPIEAPSSTRPTLPAIGSDVCGL